MVFIESKRGRKLIEIENENRNKNRVGFFNFIRGLTLGRQSLRAKNLALEILEKYIGRDWGNM